MYENKNNRISLMFSSILKWLKAFYIYICFFDPFAMSAKRDNALILLYSVMEFYIKNEN